MSTAWSQTSLPVLAEIAIETGANAAQPSLAADHEGGFVLTWQEQGEAGTSLEFAVISLEGLVERRGTVASSTPETPWFVNWADFPSLAVLDNGDWVTFWLQRSGSSTYAYDIRLTRSVDQGQSWSPPILLHRDGTQSEHGFVSLAPAGDDRVLAVWLDGRNTVSPSDDPESGHAGHSGGMTLRSAVVDRAGDISEEFEIDSLTCDCCGTDTLRLGSRFMTVYRDRTESEIRDTSFSVFTPGEGWSAPGTVHDDHWEIAGCPVNGPALAVNDDQLLAAWSTMENEQLAVRAAPGDIGGFGDMIQIEAGDQVQGRVDVVAFGERDFLLTWLGQPEKGENESAIRLAVFSPQSGPGAAQTIATLPLGRSTGFPRMASHGNLALIAWTEPGDQGSTIRVVRISP